MAKEHEYEYVCNIEDLANNSRRLIHIGNRKLLLFNYDNKISCIGAVCVHKAGPLEDGKIEEIGGEKYITCPWHGYQYNICTGKAPDGYDDKESVHDVKLEDGKVYVSILPTSFASVIRNVDHLKNLTNLKYQTDKKSLNVLCISTTVKNSALRDSTSEYALKKALEYANYNGASTKFVSLQDLKFKECEGYYSIDKKACTWPCTISQIDKNDGMNIIYQDMVLWADIVIIATPIRWGSASSLYYKMVERLNTIQNQITINGRNIIRDKIACYIVTGGQDGIQKISGEMMSFFTQLGFNHAPFSFTGWSRGWYNEDMKTNYSDIKESKEFDESIKRMLDSSIDLLRRIKS